MEVSLNTIQDLQSGLWHSFLVFLRVSAAVSLLPAFGDQNVPMRLRLVIGMAFTAIVAPAIPALLLPNHLTDLAWHAATEVTIGLALGMMVRMFVFALQISGSIAAQATSLSQLLGGSVSEPVPAMAHVMVTAGLALAMISGLHIRAAEYLIGSYEVFPPGQWIAPGGLTTWGVSQVAHIFSLAFGLAIPFVIVALVYNLALGVINRAMPQLMVAFVGAPAITAGGLIIFMLGSPLIMSVWVEALETFFDNPLRVAQ